MFCPQCGSSQSDDLKFCKTCGANLQAVRLAVAARAPGEKFDWGKTWVAEMFLSESERKKRELITMGKAKGFLTYDEVNEHMPENIVSSDQMDDWLSAFSGEGIEIVDVRHESTAAFAAVWAVLVVRLSREALPVQMAEELAKIHAIPAARVSFLPEARLERMVEELDEVGQPHPAIELGLWWLREHRPPARDPVVVHGDYRVGNLVVREDGLAGVLDWEFAHVDDPARDVAFALVRAWRFGVPEKRLGGVGGVEGYVERYNELTGFDVRPEELDYWELAGNVAWAIGCLTQMQRHLTGQDRSVELAILGRLEATANWRRVATELWPTDGPPSTPLGEEEAAWWRVTHG